MTNFVRERRITPTKLHHVYRKTANVTIFLLVRPRVRGYVVPWVRTVHQEAAHSSAGTIFSSVPFILAKEPVRNQQKFLGIYFFKKRGEMK